MSLTRGSLADCIGKLLNNRIDSDITIVFKDSHINYFAHKLIMSARSDVFNTMFHGAITDVTTNGNKIEIVDLEPESFLAVLQFMYTDKINLTEENFSQIVYAAHKYNIESLESICADFLFENLNINNVCSFLEQCFLYENAATEQCLLVIDWSITELIKLGKLDDLSEEALIMVVERDSLKIRELDLFKFFIKWSGTLSRQEKMYSVLKRLRFSTMSVEDVSECIKLRPEYFTPEEISNICPSAIRDELFYSTTKRDYRPKFDGVINVIKFEGRKISKSKKFDFQFSVDTPIAICGVRLTNEFVTVKIYTYNESGAYHALYESHTFSSNLNNYPFDTFGRDIVLIPNKKYFLETNNNNGNISMVCTHVSKGSKYENRFNFPTRFDTFVKEISFKTHR